MSRVLIIHQVPVVAGVCESVQNVHVFKPINSIMFLVGELPPERLLFLHKAC